jgi:hypothetical protein
MRTSPLGTANGNGPVGTVDGNGYSNEKTSDAPQLFADLVGCHLVLKLCDNYIKSKLKEQTFQ